MFLFKQGQQKLSGHFFSTNKKGANPYTNSQFGVACDYDGYIEELKVLAKHM